MAVKRNSTPIWACENVQPRQDHPLRGDFAGSRDCRLESDWVLIYTLTENNTHVRFERTGSHSDLFW
ncbi:MAG: type II toxin-antitoxin system YafQ family toxin [Limisphaerales bacterium]